MKANKVKIEPSELRVKKWKDIKSVRVKYNRAAELAVRTAQALKDGDTVHALLSGNFIFGDFLEALAVENCVRFKSMTLSTLAMSDENVISLENLLASGLLGHLDLIVSSYFWSHNRHNAAFIYETLCDPFGTRLAVAGIHTKIAMIETDKSKLVIHGSANMRSSRTIEAITIEANPDLYDFHKSWHDMILEDYAVTRKERRASNLWDLIGDTTNE